VAARASFGDVCGRRLPSRMNSMDPTLIFSLTLLIVATIMTYVQRQSWLAKRTSSDERKVDFAARQYRRRSQASAMIGIVALAIFAGRWIDPMKATMPWVFMTYWMAIVLVVLWVVLLAMADYVASRQYWATVRHDQAVEEARLRAEVYRMREAGSDPSKKSPGQPASDGPSDSADEASDSI